MLSLQENEMSLESGINSFRELMDDNKEKKQKAKSPEEVSSHVYLGIRSENSYKSKDKNNWKLRKERLTGHKEHPFGGGIFFNFWLLKVSIH